MLDAPDGTPAGVGAIIERVEDAATVLAPAELAERERVCARYRPDGPCHAVTLAGALDNLDLVTLRVPAAAPLGADLTVAEPGGAEEPPSLILAGRTRETPWRVSEGVGITGQAREGLLIRVDDVDALDIGAPVGTGPGSLHGVVTLIDPGTDAALMVPGSEILRQLELESLSHDLAPGGSRITDLPDEVRAQIGMIMLYSDYGARQTITYSSREGRRFAFEDGMTAELRVFSLDAHAGSNGDAPPRLLGATPGAETDQGSVHLETMIEGDAPDLAMACVIHPVTVSERDVAILGFFRANPDKHDRSLGFKGYDPAAKDVQAWAGGDAPCRAAFAAAQDDRRAALLSGGSGALESAAPDPATVPTARRFSKTSWSLVGTDAHQAAPVAGIIANDYRMGLTCDAEGAPIFVVLDFGERPLTGISMATEDGTVWRSRTRRSGDTVHAPATRAMVSALAGKSRARFILETEFVDVSLSGSAEAINGLSAWCTP